MTDKKVGIKTGKQTQAGRDVYVTPEGENVSEKSTTFKYKGMWINVPSIYKGQQYNDDTLKLMLEAEIIKPTSTHKNKKAAEKAAQERSKTLEFNQGGDVSAQMDLMLPSADDDTRSTKEFLQHPLETVPYLQRPMGSSTDDPQVGQDDAGNPVFKGSLGEYTVRVNPDQRTLRTKVEEAIPVVKEAVGDYLKDPKLPTKDQLSEFAKQAGQSAVESVEDLGDLMFKGKGTLGDVVGLAVGAGTGSIPFSVPEGALRTFGGKVQPTKSKKETNPLVQEIDYNNYNTSGDLFNFRSSVLGSLDNLAIGKDGMSGFQIKKFLEKRAPKINKTELYWSGLLENLDDNKKYSRLELENIADRNVPKVDIEVLDGSQVRYRDQQRVNLNVNNYVMQPLNGYKEIIIVNKNTKGTEYSAGHYDIMFQPDGNVLAHVRGSFVENNEPDFPIKEKFFLVEELQSDAVQQHTVADKAITKKIKEEKTSKPTLGDIGLHYKTELGSTIYSSFVQGLDFTNKFVKDIDMYNYNFRSITDGDTGAQAINLGLTKIIDDMTKLKSDFVNGNRNKDAIAFLLSREYGLKENSIKRRSIEELDEVDNIFANVLSDYVFGKSAARKYNKENNNELKENLIETFKGINITAGLEKDLVPAKLSDTIRMSLLAVIKESKSEGVNKIYIPSPKVISKAHDLNLEAAKNTYSDGVRKVLRTLNSETNGKIKFKNGNPDNITYYDGINETGIEIDITDFNLPDDPQFRFAEGGVVEDMDNQMNMAFMEEGGLQDDGMGQDPVSGNEIPNGSMASEVRDDIPAQLSEGEYVVPADVVRFFGVKFFEDLRSEAKIGLQQMDKDGRIGGEPVAVTAIMGAAPISDAELDQLIQQELSQEAKPTMAMGGLMAGQQPTMQQQPMMQQQQSMMQPQPNPYQQQQMMYNKPTINMNKGGFISTSMESLRAGYAPGGSVTGFDPSKYSYGGTGSGMGSGLKVVQYVNDAGNIRWYTFIDGKIQPPGTKIPAGYKPSDPSLNAPLPETPVTPPPDTGITPPDSGDRDDKNDGGGGSKDPQDQIEIDMSKKLKEVDWNGDLLEQAKSFVQDSQGQDISKLGGAAALLGGPGAIIGGIMGVGGKIMELESISNARAMALIAEARGDTKAANKINEFVDSHVKARGGLIDFADGFVAKGTMRANDFAKDLGFNSLEEAFSKDIVRFGSDTKYSDQVKGKSNFELAERKLEQQKRLKNIAGLEDAQKIIDSQGDDGPSAAQIAAAQSKANKNDKKQKEKIISSGNTYSSKPKEAIKEMKDKGTFNVGGRAKGGLMLKKKK